jgi:predicted ribosome quality control (RQC) complex YloA/Tae2 family protein
MPLDAVVISALAAEIGDKITGGRIDKVQMPERDVLLLSIRGQKENLRLIISSNVGSSRIHFTRASFENPAEPPMFCMLMRKHLTGARIVSVTQPERERMLVLELDTRDEMGVESRKKLVAELMGRSSNIVLVGEDGNIIDCIRRMDFGGDALRRLLPGMIYRMPPRQDKAGFFDTPAGERARLWRLSDPAVPPEKRLMDIFSGLSPLICRELAYRCYGDEDNMPEAMDALAESAAAGDFTPYMLTRDGEPLDFSFMRISQYGKAAQGQEFPDFSSMLDEFYSKRDKAESLRRRGRDLAHSVRTARDRTARKLEARRSELQKTAGREKKRHAADLITANMYRMKKGDEKLVCEDFYAEGSPETTIALDPLKTPQQNAASLYREYNKLKTAESCLGQLIAENEKQLDYLNSVLDEIERAESEKDLADIRRELTDTGFIKRPRGGKPDRSKAQGPMSFVSSDGLEILVGRSNAMNDELTFKTARRTDYWLHAQKIHGSHVIIRCEGLEPPERTIEEAAGLAVYYSQSRAAGRAAVDYTMARNIKKPSGAMPGFVIYNDYRTIFAQGDEKLAEKLKNR